jgi:NAD(P)-dependent dehydrogenase (short-subunit alcohol dehydrogenase family)
MRLKDKVALITGAGSGIGRCIALLLAKEGAHIAVNDINLSLAEKTADEVKKIGRKAMSIKADVGEESEVDYMVTNVIEELGGVHILVNNAGIFDEAVPTIESSVDKWDQVMKVHLRGSYLCCRRVGQWMVSNKTGKVVNISSVVGMVGMAPRTAYTLAKAAIIQQTRCLAVEWAPYSINVNCVAPGWVWTPLTENVIKKKPSEKELIERRIPLGRWGECEDIANAVLFLVSEEANYITGVTIPVDGGFLASSGLTYGIQK